MFCNLSDRNQLIRGDFARRDARDNGIGSVPLNVGQIAVIGVLQGNVFAVQDVFVPCRCQDRCHGGFADLAAESTPVARQQIVERLELVQPHQMEEILAGVGKMLAQVIRDRDAGLLQLELQEITQQRDARAAPGARLGTRFQGRDRVHPVRDGRDDCAFVDVVARTDHGAGRQSVNPKASGLFTTALREDQIFGPRGHGYLILNQLQQLPVLGGVAHQDSAQEVLAVRGQDQLLVDRRQGVERAHHMGAGRRREGIAEARDVNPQQLELGAHVETREDVAAAAQRRQDHLGHVVAGRHEAKRSPPVAGAFADRENVRVGRATAFIDDDATTRRDRQSRGPPELVAWSDAGREHHDVRRQRRAIGE